MTSTFNIYQPVFH